MKRRNIAFSGFMAAILLGAGAANAATTQIASRQYVDAAVDEIQTDIDALDTVVNDPDGGLAAQVQGAVDKADAASSAVEQLGSELDSKLDSATADATYEKISNRTQELTADTSAAMYPTVGAVRNYVQTEVSGLSSLPVDPGKMNDNSLEGSKLKDGAVTTDKIANDAVTSDKIADGAVGSEHIQTGAVGSDEIADGSVTGADIANGTISADKLDSALNTKIDGKEDKINKATTIDSTNQASTDEYPSVKAVYDWTTAQIANVEFDPSTDLGAGSVSGDKITDGTITGNKIADGSVTGADIANGTISADKLDSALNAEIDGKQDKNMGAGHESHIVTTDENGTITSVAAIEQAQVTGLTDALEAKANTADIPTAVSELTNDSGYLTNADMTGYAKTTDLDAKQNKNIGADHSGKILTVGADGNITTSATIAQSAVDGLDTVLAAKADAGDLTTINETIETIEQSVTNITAPDSGLLAQKEDASNKTKAITPENKSSESLFPTIGAITQWTNTEIQKIRDEGIDIGTDNIGEGAVQTVNLANGAVTTEKIADNAVTSDKLSDDIVAEINGKADANNVYTKTETDSKILEVALRRPVNTCTGASLCVLSITPENGLAWVNVTDPVGELPGPTVDLDAPSDGGQ